MYTVNKGDEHMFEKHIIKPSFTLVNLSLINHPADVQVKFDIFQTLERRSASWLYRLVIHLQLRFVALSVQVS